MCIFFRKSDIMISIKEQQGIKLYKKFPKNILKKRNKAKEHRIYINITNIK